MAPTATKMKRVERAINRMEKLVRRTEKLVTRTEKLFSEEAVEMAAVRLTRLACSMKILTRRMKKKYHKLSKDYPPLPLRMKILARCMNKRRKLSKEEPAKSSKEEGNPVVDAGSSSKEGNPVADAESSWKEEGNPVVEAGSKEEVKSEPKKRKRKKMVRSKEEGNQAGSKEEGNQAGSKEEGKSEPKKRKRKKMVRLDERYVFHFLEEPHIRNFHTIPDWKLDLVSEPARLKELSLRAFVKEYDALRDDIERQMFLKGYVEHEVEVTDDEGSDQ